MISDETDVNLFLVSAKEYAQKGDYDSAIGKLRECLKIVESKRDYDAAASILLLIVDFEKLRSAQESSEDQEVVAKAATSEKEEKVPTKKAVPLKGKKQGKPPVVKSNTVPVKKRTFSMSIPLNKEELISKWEDGKKLVEMGDTFKGTQILISVRRDLQKLHVEPELIKKLEDDINAAKQQSGFSVSSVSSVVKPVNTRASSSSSPSVSSSDQSKPASSNEIATLLRKAKEAKDGGKYKVALDFFKSALKIANDMQKKAIMKNMRKVEHLARLKERMQIESPSSASFASSETVSVSPAVPSPSSSGIIEEVNISYDIGLDRRLDRDEKEKLMKRKEAEKLIVEAENCENVSEAIEKFQDAAHLLLVTGTRRDRVEWVYEKINALKKYGKIKKKDLLFENVTFSPSILRRYAFNEIDKAKNKARYGKYKESLDCYIKAIKALRKAGWTKEQINYIIDDMIKIQKKQDRVEAQEKRLREIHFKYVSDLLSKDNAVGGDAISAEEEFDSYDEGIYRPRREKTVLEKEIEKIQQEQQERLQLKATMFEYLDEAKHNIDIGKFKDALEDYKSALAIMESLGGWDRQKHILLEEIKNIEQAIKKREEISRIQEERVKVATVNEKDKLSEQSVLIKKAMMLNQEQLKEKLLMKKINEEKINTVFNILIPAANKLKNEGRNEDALIEYQEALKFLKEAGWVGNTQILQDEISKLKSKLNIKEQEKLSVSEKRQIRNEVLEELIPMAQKAASSGDFGRAKQLYHQAIEQLEMIGWKQYIGPLKEEIEKINEKIREKEDEGEGKTRDQKMKMVNELVDSSMKFLSWDIKDYALMELKKALKILEEIGEDDMYYELHKESKKIELELKLEDSERILLSKKKLLSTKEDTR
ncbi:MAG: hypothetical protein ACTSVI_13795 [Promethearchaeota archaeon]